MKTNKKKQALQKQVIESKLQRFAKLNEPIPASGWVKAIRGALGMTAKQLALRLGVSPSSVTQLEEREVEKKISIELLEKVAHAMDCTFVYAIVPAAPYNSLDEIIETKAQLAAMRILKEVEHTMRLEAQGTTNKNIKKQIEKMADELKLTSDSRIWDVSTLKKSK